jgi:hypothetical protein
MRSGTMVFTDHQIYQTLMGIEARLSELDKHTATGLAGLDASLKLHQQETRHYRHGILSRLDAVEKTLETFQTPSQAVSFMPGLTAALTSPAVLRLLLAAGMVLAGFSIGEIGDMMARVP